MAALTFNTQLFEELTWQNAREYLTDNPTLVDIIDQLNPSNHFTMYKIVYAYGDAIIRNPVFQIPLDEHHLTPISNTDIPFHIREQLNYNFDSNPVGVISQGAIEICLDLGERIIPFGLLKPGQVFGLWKTLDPVLSHCPPKFCFEMTSGLRSIFMLPKISDKISHSKLVKAFQINLDPPKLLKDHWDVFKALIRQAKSPWQTEVLFFTKPWMTQQHDSAWDNFYKYLYQMAWKSSEFWRNQFIWRLTFSRINQLKEMKPSIYISNIVNNLFEAAVGVLPGYAPAIDDFAAPIHLLQSIYVDIYGLKEYAPTIMSMSRFDFKEEAPRPIYLSLQLPTAIELNLKSYGRSTALTDLYHVYILLNKYLEAIQKTELYIETTPLHNLPRAVDFSFFHSSENEYRDILDTETIVNEDNSFLCPPFAKRNDKFPRSSTFLNGCIRIKKHDDFSGGM